MTASHIRGIQSHDELVDNNNYFYCCRFRFLKAIGKELVTPNVPQIHEWTGDKVRQIAGQGDLYITTTYDLNLDGLKD